MNILQRIAIFCALCIALTSFAETVTFQYGDNSSWSGELGQTVAIEYNDRGETKRIEGALTKVKKKYIYVAGELIFITDIVNISGNNSSKGTDNSDNTPVVSNSSKNTPSKIAPVKDGDLPVSVFILPMEGMVGETMRATELDVLATYIDENYGKGQVIVLKVDSGGGYGRTWSDIKDVIFKVRENHRVVAWIESAISAAAMTVYCCDEMYYTSLGEVGSCTGYSGSPNNPLSPEGQQVMIDEMEKVIAQSSRTPYLAACMFLLDKWLTYDKDPITGEITYYNTPEGNFHLSSGTNLTLSAKQAFEGGLCDGIANTEEELLTLLNLEDAEVNRYGEELFENWQKTMKDFQNSIEDLSRIAQEGDPRANTEKKLLNSQIKACEQILKWADKLGEVALYNGLDEDRVKMIKRQILDLERQLQLIDN